MSRAHGARRRYRPVTFDLRGVKIASKPSERPPKIRNYSLSKEMRWYVPLTSALTTFAESRHCMKFYKNGLKMGAACDPDSGDTGACCAIKRNINPLAKKCKVELLDIGKGTVALAAHGAVDKMSTALHKACSLRLEKLEAK